MAKKPAPQKKTGRKMKGFSPPTTYKENPKPNKKKIELRALTVVGNNSRDPKRETIKQINRRYKDSHAPLKGTQHADDIKRNVKRVEKAVAKYKKKRK